MSDTATAEEKSIEAESGSEKSAEAWDFTTPNRIPHEQEETIGILLKSFAEAAPGSLSTFLCCEVELSLDNLEQATFSEYTKSLGNPTCLAVLEMQPLSGFSIMEVNSILLYSLVDKLLGGEGSSDEVKRPFTDLELTVSRKFFTTILRELDNAWTSILSLNFSVREFQTNPAAVRVIPTRETCLVATFKAQIGSASGLITLAIPYLSLEPIASKLSNRQFSNRYRKKQPEEIAAAHRRNFGQIEVPVAAVLGSVDLTMVELLSLQKGDIVPIGRKVHDPVDIIVSNKKKFSATPGLIGKYKGALINEEV